MIGGSSSTFDNVIFRLRGESDVLYVVDGIKVYAMSDINTDNIASISVLKGAAATALYGADAKSGVIVITSKKAKAGETSFSIDHSTSVSSMYQILPNYQNEYGGGYDQDWDTIYLQSCYRSCFLGEHLHGHYTFLIMQLMNLGDLRLDGTLAKTLG